MFKTAKVQKIPFRRWKRDKKNIQKMLMRKGELFWFY